eukprot:6514017-Pyramimonas_sp.AAC.1
MLARAVLHMAACQPQRKKGKLSELGRESHVTQSGLSKLLKQLHSEDLPDAFSRYSIKVDREKIAFQPT